MSRNPCWAWVELSLLGPGPEEELEAPGEEESMPPGTALTKTVDTLRPLVWADCGRGDTLLDI